MPDVTGLAALDTAIGLVFLYFLLSTACSMLNESIASVLGWRAKTLEIAIRNLLGDAAPAAEPAPGTEEEPGSPPRNLTAELFDHWRIRGLVRDPDARARRRRRPSYLPPRAFSLAVAETIAKGPPKQDPKHADDPTLWQKTDDKLFQELKTELDKLPDPRARALLYKAAANAGGTLDGFRIQLESAFDDVMERASGWYKRKVQVVLIVLAAAIAIGLNVDSVRVANSLWHDAPVRSAVAAQAAKQADPATAGSKAANVQELQLPVGWGPNKPKNLLSAIPGWLITIAALGLGAPFWFDLLSRLARLRGSGVPERPRSLSDTAGTGTSARSTTAARVAADK
jgi:hypothetical protein